MNKIKQDIKNNDFSRVYLLYGSEQYLKRLYKNKLKEAIVSDGDTMNYTYAEGKDIDVNEIMHIADTMPFFADRRLILIENSGWFKNQSAFADYIKELPDSTYVVFVENEIDKRNRLYKAVKEIGYLCEMNGMDERNLKLWILSLLKKDNLQITGQTLSYFLDKVGSSMDNIESELFKLTSYCLGRTEITVSDIDAVCCEQITGKMFQMLDAIAMKDQKTALMLYYDLLTLREKPMTILYLLNRQINLLLQTKAMTAKHMDNAAMASKLSVPPFAVRKYVIQAKNYKEPVLYAALNLGTELEEKVKSGLISDRIAVELLIIQTINEI